MAGVGCGSKCEIPAASKCFPLCPHKRTSTGTNVVSEKCQYRKWRTIGCPRTSLRAISRILGVGLWTAVNEPSSPSMPEAASRTSHYELLPRLSVLTLRTNGLPVDQTLLSPCRHAVCKCCCCEPLLFGAMYRQNFVELRLHGRNIFPLGAHCISSGT